MTKAVVVEMDRLFSTDTAIPFESRAAAEEYARDLAAAYAYSEGVDIRVIDVSEPLDAAGLKGIIAEQGRIQV